MHSRRESRWGSRFGCLEESTVPAQGRREGAWERAVFGLWARVCVCPTPNAPPTPQAHSHTHVGDMWGRWRSRGTSRRGTIEYVCPTPTPPSTVRHPCGGHVGQEEEQGDLEERHHVEYWVGLREGAWDRPVSPAPAPSTLTHPWCECPMWEKGGV